MSKPRLTWVKSSWKRWIARVGDLSLEVLVQTGGHTYTYKVGEVFGNPFLNPRDQNGDVREYARLQDAQVAAEALAVKALAATRLELIQAGCPLTKTVFAGTFPIRPAAAPNPTHLTFDELRRANTRRCEDSFYPIEERSPNDWAVALAEECGEVARICKRVRDGKRTIPDARADLGHELADVVMYADLLATRFGVELGPAVTEKFNIVSERLDPPSPIRLGGSKAQFVFEPFGGLLDRSAAKAAEDNEE